MAKVGMRQGVTDLQGENFGKPVTKKEKNQEEVTREPFHSSITMPEGSQQGSRLAVALIKRGILPWEEAYLWTGDNIGFNPK